MTMTAPDAELTALRARIDELDAQVIAHLAARFAATQRVGELKAAHQWPSVDAQREHQQAARYAELARAHGLDPALVQRIFRAVIDEVVQNHRQIAQAAVRPPAG